jgi:hypothetical protein
MCNREWITLLACICASGDALPPALIYQGTSRVQWRLLILDGHASHLTPGFLEFCEAKRIMVMVYLPHPTHNLQPLDVVLFGPLSKHYTEELTQHLQRTQGLLRITKRDFYRHFWPAWSSVMTHDLTLKSFQATGVWPMDADPVLQRFNNDPQQQDNEPGIGEQGKGDTWSQLRKIFDAAVADKAKFEAKRLSQGLHSLQVNKLLRLQNAELRVNLNLVRKHPIKSTTLTNLVITDS